MQTYNQRISLHLIDQSYQFCSENIILPHQRFHAEKLETRRRNSQYRFMNVFLLENKARASQGWG